MIFLGSYKSGVTVKYRANFHSDQGTLENPTSPEAQREDPANAFTALTAPAQINARTGYFGGSIDTTGFAVGQHLIRMAGTVSTAKVASTAFCFEIVAYDPADAVGLGLSRIDAAITTRSTPINITAATGIVLSGVTHAGAVIPTVTTLTNLPAISANWLTAVGINASALNGKGDWNIGKTGYALAATGLDAIGQAATGMVEIAKAVWDRILSGATHNIPGSSGRRVRQIQSAVFSFDGTISGTPSTTVIPLDAGASATNNFYVPGLIIIESSFGVQFQRIASYAGATKQVTVADAFTTVPVNGDSVTIAPLSSIRVTSMAADVLNASALAADAVTEIQAGLATAAALATVQADTDDIQARIPAVLIGGKMDASLGAIAAGVDLSATMKTSVNAEVVDGLAVDTYAEPGQGTPAATATLAAKINHLFKNFLNRKTQTATEFKLFNNAGTVVDVKSTVSDDTTTATKGNLTSGP